MTTQAYIPQSIEEAKRHLSDAFDSPVDQLSLNAFEQVWSSVCFLNPGLHPDGYEDGDSGWPEALRKFAAEAWRRFNAGEIDEDVLYPSDATHAGLMALMSMTASFARQT